MGDNKRAINPTRSLLLKISKKLTNEELKDMKYLCSERIADGVLEDIKTVLDLFNKISQLDDTGDNGISYISELLKEIGRENLSNELLGIPNNDQIPEKPNEDMKVLLEIENRVAAEWKILARHLGLDGDLINQIDADNNIVREKCASALNKWKRKVGFDLVALKKALLAIGRKDVVDEIPKLQGCAIDEDTTVPIQPSDDADAEEGVSSEKSGASGEKGATASYMTSSGQSATHTSVKTSSKGVIQPPKKASSGLSSKYNINIHPGSQVMVGDCGQMTIYANTKVDQKTLAFMKQNAVNLGGQGGGGASR